MTAASPHGAVYDIVRRRMSPDDAAAYLDPKFDRLAAALEQKQPGVFGAVLAEFAADGFPEVRTAVFDSFADRLDADQLRHLFSPTDQKGE